MSKASAETKENPAPASSSQLVCSVDPPTAKGKPEATPLTTDLKTLNTDHPSWPFSIQNQLYCMNGTQNPPPGSPSDGASPAAAPAWQMTGTEPVFEATAGVDAAAAGAGAAAWAPETRAGAGTKPAAATELSSAAPRSIFGGAGGVGGVREQGSAARATAVGVDKGPKAVGGSAKGAKSGGLGAVVAGKASVPKQGTSWWSQLGAAEHSLIRGVSCFFEGFSESFEAFFDALRSTMCTQFWRVF